jgi:hypothetical protein
MGRSISNIFICSSCNGEGGYHHKGCSAGYKLEIFRCKCGHAKEAHGGTFPKAISGKGKCCLCDCKEFELKVPE